MAVINIDVQDNQSDLDALKQQVKAASDAINAAMSAGQTALDALQAFQISFTASVAG